MRRRGEEAEAGTAQAVWAACQSTACIAGGDRCDDAAPARVGEKAVDQLAESELGRLALRGELEPVLAAAGADYARHWRGYIASLCAESL